MDRSRRKDPAHAAQAPRTTTPRATTPRATRTSRAPRTAQAALRALLFAALCAVLAAGLCGCGGKTGAVKNQTPTEATKTFLEALKAQDTKAMGQVYAGEPMDFLAAAQPADGEDDLTKALRETLTEKWYDFDYELSKAVPGEDKNTATVGMSITTYDMDKIFERFYKKLVSTTLEQFSGSGKPLTAQEQEDLAREVLQQELNDATEKDYTVQTSLSLTKSGDGWKVDKIKEDSSFVDAVTGGTIAVLQNLEEGGSLGFAAPEQEE